MASTYPLEVVEAARWVKTPANHALVGDALTGALQAQSWDPSVKALVPFARLLENEQPAAMDRAARQRLSRAAGRCDGRGAKPAPRSNGRGQPQADPAMPMRHPNQR